MTVPVMISEAEELLEYMNRWWKAAMLDAFCANPKWWQRNIDTPEGRRRLNQLRQQGVLDRWKIAEQESARVRELSTPPLSDRIKASWDAAILAKWRERKEAEQQQLRASVQASLVDPPQAPRRMVAGDL